MEFIRSSKLNMLRDVSIASSWLRSADFFHLFFCESKAEMCFWLIFTLKPSGEPSTARIKRQGAAWEMSADAR